MRACWPAIVAAACALAPLIAAAGEPTVVRDGLDRVVTLPAPPQRIVTIFASNTEMVAALGLTDRIVGIEAYTRYPPEVVSKPLVGGRLGFSVDAVVGLRPDLVVVTPARQAVNQLLDPMERLGIPVLVLLQRSVPEIFANIRLLGRVAGVLDWSEALAGRLERRLAVTTQRVKGRQPPRAVMITGRVGNGLLLMARPGTYTGDALELAGGRFALGRPWCDCPGIARGDSGCRSRRAALCRLRRRPRRSDPASGLERDAGRQGAARLCGEPRRALDSRTARRRWR